MSDRADKIMEDILGEDQVRQFKKMDIDSETLMYLYHELDEDKQVFKSRAKIILESEHIQQVHRGTQKVIQSLLEEIEGRQQVRRQIIKDSFKLENDVV